MRNEKPFEQDVSSKYGAPMGRRSDNLSGKTHLQRVPMFDGDYDKGGAYWGGGRGVAPLWCAWNDNGATYLRAYSRNEAKAMLPDCTFYR